MSGANIGITLSADDRELLAALRSSGSELTRFAKGGTSSLGELEQATRANQGAMAQLAGGMKTAFIGGGVAAAIITIKNALQGTTMALIDAQQQADKVKNSLSFAMGGSQAAEEIKYLRQVTDQLGVSFAAVAPMYGRLAAATKGTALEGRATREIFESIAQASVVMGLGVEESEGAMRALVQMVSKGQIQAEELRGQLGERLPRAFQIFAESMGVSTAELSKLLEAGKVGPEVLANFAATLKGELAGSLDEATTRLASSVNRLDNSWLRLKQNVSESGVSSFMSGQMAVLNDAISDVAVSMEKAREGGSGFTGQMVSAGGAVLRFLNPFNSFTYTVQDQATKLRIAQDQLKEYSALLEKEPNNVFLIRGVQQIKETVAWLQAANAEKDKFSASGAGAGRGSVNPATVGDMLAAEARQAAELAAIRQKLSGVDKDYLPTLTKLHEAYERGAISMTEYVRLVSDLAEKNYKAEKTNNNAAKAARDAAAEREKLAKAEQKRWEDLGKAISANDAATNKWLDQNARTLEGLIDANEKLRLQNEAIGLNTAATDALTLSRMDAAIALAELNLIDAQNIEGNAARVDQIEREIRLLKERKELTAAGQVATAAAEAQKTAKEAAEKAAKEAADAWQKSADEINQALSDALMDAFMAGEGFGKTFVNSIKSMFNSMVLKPVISAIVSPVAGAVTGGLGIGGQGGSALSGASSLYGIGSQVFGGGMSVGNGLGTLAANATGAGLDGLLATNAAYGTAAAGGSSALAGLAAAAPYLAVIAAAWYAIKKYGLDAESTPHAGGGSQYSASGGLLTTGTLRPEQVIDAQWGSDQFGNPKWYDKQVIPASMGPDAEAKFNGGFTSVAYGQQAVDMTTGVVQGIVGLLDATAIAFGKEAGYQAAASFADDSSKDGAWGNLRIEDVLGNVLADWQAGGESFRTFSDGQAGAGEFQAAAAADVLGILKQIDMPAWATGMLASIGDTPDLSALAASVATINLVADALKAMGKNMVGFAGMSDAAVSSLIAASGGFEKLATNAGAYYDAFYSDEEKTANTLRDVGEALQAVGLELPATREEFRALVEAQQALDTAGAPAVAALLGVAGAFAAVVPAAEDAATATTDLAAAEKALAAERASLMDQLWAATNQTALIRAKEMAALDPSSRPIQQALYDIADAQDAFTALQTSVQTAKDEVTRKYEAEKAALQEQAEADLSYLKTAADAQKDAIEAELAIKRQGYADQISAAKDARAAITSIASALASAVKSVQIESEAYDLMRLKAARATIAAAAGSGNINASGLGDALGVAGQDSKRFYATFEDYAFDQAKTAGDIGLLNDSAQAQLSGFDQTIAALQASDALAKALAEAQMAALDAQYQLDLASAQAQAALTAEGTAAQLLALEAQYQLDIAALDQTLTDAQAQLNALLGIDDSVKTVAQALDGFTTAVLAAVGSVASVAADDAAVQTAAVIKAAMATSSLSWIPINNSGGSKESPHDLGIMGFAAGGYHAGGLRIVGENGPELEATGPSRIWTAPQIGNALGGNSNAELAAEVRGLRAELAASTRAIAVNTLETAKTLKRWNGDGMPEERVV